MPGLHKQGNSAYQNVNALYSHIMDPNERRRMALAEIDKAPLSWYHLRLVVVTGVGFFTDAYSLFAINLATTMLGMVFWQDSHNGTIPDNAATAIKVATSAGTVFGQVVFGYLADLWGRKRMYGIELLIIISGTLAQALCGNSESLSIVGVLVFWRIFMGIGVGGDYPLSAVITSEMADTKWRGAMMGAVFAMQGLGQFVAAMMALLVTYGYRDTLRSVPNVGSCSGDCTRAVDVMWRIVLGFGGVPGWFALYYRLTIPETPRYTFDVKHDLEKATADNAAFLSGRRGEGQPNRMIQAANNQDMLNYYQQPPSFKEFCRYFSKTKHLLTLIGTAGSWFFLDIAFYGLNLNTGQIMAIIGFAQKANVYQYLYNAAVGQLVLTCAGAIPGYWFTVGIVDWIGRKPIQIGGFAILTLIFAVIGFNFNSLSQKALLTLYILAQFFFNFGPNATTFIVPAECFPTRIRATAHGVSAAAGKIGATIAQLAFAPLVSKGATPEHPHPWLDKVMQMFALFMLCGLLTSFLIPETKRKTLEELAGENEHNRAYELKFVSGFFRQEKHDSVHDITVRAGSSSSSSRSRLGMREGRRKGLGAIYHRYFRFSS